jgi:Bacterial Ig-like domain (group 2)
MTPTSPSIAVGATQQFTATGTYQNSSTADITRSVTWNSATPAVATIDAAGLATGVSAGTSNITATSGAITSNTAVLTVTETPALDQAITFAALASKTLAQSPVIVSAQASSGLTVSFTASGACSSSSTNGEIIDLGPSTGTCTVTAHQAGNGTYNAALDVSRSFTVSKANQTITFVAPPTQAFATGSVTVSASASSGLVPVVFTTNTPTKCSVSGTTVTFVATGTCTIRANQAGDSIYNAAPQVSRSFSIVTKLNSTITFGSIPNHAAADADFSVTASSSSGEPVTFSSTTSPLICTVTSGGLVGVGPNTGTCTIKADAGGNAYYNAAPSVNRSFSVVAFLNQTITFATISSKALAQSGFTVSATAPAGPVTYTSLTTGVCTLTGSTVNLVSAGSCKIQATQLGDTIYNAAAPITRTFTVVTKLNQTINFPAIANRTLAQPPLTLNAVASSSLPVSYTNLTTSVCTLNGTTVTLQATGICSIKADQIGDALYNLAPSVTRSFSVSMANQTITFPAISSKSLTGTPTFTVSATASSGLVVAFTSTTPAVCSVTGDQVTLITTGTCTIKADQAGNTVYNAAPSVSRSFTVTP